VSTGQKDILHLCMKQLPFKYINIKQHICQTQTGRLWKQSISYVNKIVKLLGSLIHWACHLWMTTLGSVKPFDVCENGAVISSCTLLSTSFPEKKSRTHSTVATSAL
jgi:hypothetical protein